LLRPLRSGFPASRGRTTMAAGLATLITAAMTDRLCRVARWERYDARSKAWVKIDPPEKIANTILSRVGEWTMPAVAGVITTPTLRPDGTLLTAPGYDKATRLYHMRDVALDLTDYLPDRPTRQDAKRALDDLRHLLSNFPVTNDTDHSVALSALISPVVRGAVGVVPMHAFRASTAGTGKTFLVDVAAAIATSRPCPVATVAKSEEETEKRLAGLLLAAFPLICLDNVNGELGGDLLCQAIERPIVQIRPLGTSDIIEVESRATIFATGNVLRVRGDMTRRTLICNLDAKVERPELRTFDFDPVETVLADRKRYVGAVLTIVLAHAQAGFPGQCTPLASFGDWSRYVRAALMWLGCADPCASMEDAREDDPELSELRELLDAWSNEFIDTASYTVAEIVGMIAERFPPGEHDDGQGALRFPRMREIVLRVSGGRFGVDPRRLGAFLRTKEGRIVNGYRLVKAGMAGGGVARWRVDRLVG
jgi:putative DNA primase/helicase